MTIEVAIVLPLIILPTMGLLEYGWLFLKAQQVTNAAHQGARVGARTGTTAADLDFDNATDRPPTARTLCGYAKMLAAGGKDAQAQTALANCMNRYPAFLPAYVAMADLHVRYRRFDTAIAYLQRGLAEAPDDPILHNALGMCWLLKGEYGHALAEFNAASEASPDDARLTANAALATGMLGRFDEALALYQHVVLPGQAHYNLGVICEAKDDHERAQQEFALAAALGYPRTN